MKNVESFAGEVTNLKCEGQATFVTNCFKLICSAAACAQSIGDGEKIGIHILEDVDDTRRIRSLARESAILEIPLVCERLADFDRNRAADRLPKGLR